MEFGAVASVGDTYVACNGASADDICTEYGINNATNILKPTESEINPLQTANPELEVNL